MEIELVDAVESQRTVYYAMGGAFRIIGGSDAGLYYRHTDHLNSTSVLSDSTGAKLAGSEVVFAPFGEVRAGAQSDLTDFGYTGQRSDVSSGLMYYGARYYLPELRRFISADTIVPGAANPQAFNRYSYVLNNPVNLIDPSGHTVCLPGECKGDYGPIGGGGGNPGGGGSPGGGTPPPTSDSTPPATEDPVDQLEQQLGDYGVEVHGHEGLPHKDQVTALSNILEAVEELAQSSLTAIYEILPEAELSVWTAEEAFKRIFGAVVVDLVYTTSEFLPGTTKYGINTDGTNIRLSSYALINGGSVNNVPLSGVQLAAHEISHNLTWAGYDNYPGIIKIAGQKVEYPNGLGVHAGDYGNPLCYDCEVTADAIASWGLDDFGYGTSFVTTQAGQHRQQA
jgi:RHS repeat-associated protein